MRSLMSLGKWKVSDHTIQFRTHSAESTWNTSMLFDAVLHGLSPAMKDQLVPLDLRDDLDALITLTIKID